MLTEKLEKLNYHHGNGRRQRIDDDAFRNIKK